MTPVCASCGRYRFRATMREVIKRCPRCKVHNAIIGLSTATVRPLSDGPATRYAYTSDMKMRGGLARFS